MRGESRGRGKGAASVAARVPTSVAPTPLPAASLASDGHSLVSIAPATEAEAAAKQAEVEAAVRDLLALQGIQAPAPTP